MSDYLGMLASRYLGQGGSIRPEPVAMYQAPSPDWDLVVDASPADEAAVDGGEGEPRLPSTPAPPVSPSRSDTSFASSTSGGASFARSPSGEEHAEVESITRPPSAHVGGARPPLLAGRPVADAPIDASARRPSTPLVDGRTDERVASVPALAIQRPLTTLPRRQTGSSPSSDPHVEQERSAIAPSPIAPPRGDRRVDVGPRGAERRMHVPPMGAERRVDVAPNDPEPFAPSPSAVAPHQAIPPMREESTEPPPLRFARSFALPQIAREWIRPRLEPAVRPLEGRRETPAPALPRIKGQRETAPSKIRDVDPDVQPIVEISIDEINIRAAPAQPPAPPRRDRLVRPPMSLDDYLRRRAGASR